MDFKWPNNYLLLLLVLLLGILVVARVVYGCDVVGVVGLLFLLISL